jgi:sialate O-acetylesterase
MLDHAAIHDNFDVYLCTGPELLPTSNLVYHLHLYIASAQFPPHSVGNSMYSPFPRRSFLATFLFTFFLSPTVRSAELKLGCLFSDHMVLQRDKPVPVWGWGEPGKQVSVSFAGQTKSAVADKDGKWMVKLDPLTTNASGQTMKVQSGEKSIDVNDILIGEVWLGSGQSNMAMTVSRSRDFDKEQAEANLPLIRSFKEGSASAQSAQQDGKGKWEVCSSESVGLFSATLYFFGKSLHKELNVPIGLINSSVGGTPIEAWIDGETQKKTPELKGFFNWLEADQAAFDREAAKAAYQKQLAKWEVARDKAKADKKPLPTKPRDPVETRDRKADIGGLFNGKIAPLIPFAMRGFIWYQGEANGHPGKSPHYRFQLPLLITDWRKRWGEELPTAWVQLPNFGRTGEHWAEVREGMLQTLKLPKTGMAIAIDLGDEKDIHPKNKQDVGKRLALWALGDIYGQKVNSTSGPIPTAHSVNGQEIRVSFSHADGGLKPKEGELKGFIICGPDKQWKSAKVRIEGNQIIASSPEVTSPVALRYSWDSWPDGNLINGFNLPASPFRTDAPR